MPCYKKKITSLLEYEDFKKQVNEMDLLRDRAFLTLLFFSGCRISEAIALTPNDITCTDDTIYIQFFRLKGSKQTDPSELPRVDALNYLCGYNEDPFQFSRMTGYRIVRRCFSELYPHYFRMNRITKVLDRFGVATVQNTFGLSLNAIQAYIGKVDIKRVGKLLRDEVSK